MKRRCVSCLALIVVVSLGAAAQEKKIQRSELPPAVEETVKAQSAGATIRGFSEEIEHGKTFYEAEMVVGDHSKDILIDGDGKVVEVEEQVAFDTLPPAVQQGLRAKAGNGQLGKVESLTKNGKLVAYEAKVLNGGKKSEVHIGPDGKPLEHEE